MGGHNAEVWEALRVPGNAVTITGDPQVVAPLFSSSRDDHVAGARIATVLNEFSHSLERIALGKGNDVMAFQSSPMRSFPLFFLTVVFLRCAIDFLRWR